MAQRAKTRRGIWLGLVIVLAAPLGFSRLTLGQEQKAQAGKEAKSFLDVIKMPIRGPDQAVVGRRFTLEFLITNTGTSTVKDLVFLADIDASLDHETAGRKVRIKVEPIEPQNLQIVRLRLTPRKKGQAGVDITLRGSNGEAHRIRHQLSVLDKEDAPALLQKAGDLKVTITPPRECFAERPGIFLIHVLNTGSKATERKNDLGVSYSTANLPGNILPTSGPEPVLTVKIKRSGLMMVRPSNPVRQTQISFPSLEPGEGWTLPVRITPRRIGELRVSVGLPEAVLAKMPDIHIPMLANIGVQVKFDPRTPLDQFLPVLANASSAPRLPEKLADVPEVAFEGRQSKTVSANDAFEHVAHTVDKIHHVNAKKTDAFVEALLEKRADLAGLPMAMGDSCRLKPERAQQFLIELQNLRSAMGNHGNLAVALAHTADSAKPQARIAALMQVLGPQSGNLRREMVKVFAAISHIDATRALANLAIFSEEEAVRRVALDALKTRRDQDYSDILHRGLNYPWPAVAQRTGKAIVQLKRNDLIPQLVNMLESPDPRAPQIKEIHGKKVPVVRELVKINHLRNCLLCHAPASANATPQLALVQSGSGKLPFTGSVNAPVPLPNQQLPAPSPSGGYGQFEIPGTLVRIDVTYLRQDFSVMLPVADAKPWPDQQRFDFLVRTRQITENEAKACRELLKTDAKFSPYQRVALASLRDLTGQDAGTSAPAWRRLVAAKNADSKRQ